MFKRHTGILLAILWPWLGFAGNTFRVCSYNALNFDDGDFVDSGCFELVLSEIAPDLVSFQELDDRGVNLMTTVMTKVAPRLCFCRYLW